MDFLYINSKSIKISISRKELGECGIAIENFDYESIHCKRFVFELLEKAYEKLGFDTVGAETLDIRVFRSLDGGCELFVIKCENSRVESNITNEKSPKSSQHARRTETVRAVVIFENDNDLYDLCLRLETIKSKGAKIISSLYCDESKNRLILSLGIRIGDKSKRFGSCGNILSVMTEYGKVYTERTLCDFDEINAYLSEHCVCLTDVYAIERLLCLK